MKLSWDPEKCSANVRKHGLDFQDAGEVFQGVTVTVPDDRLNYGEERWITLGMLKGVVVVLAHTESGKEMRIISMRKASKNEKKAYLEAITH